MQTCTLRINDSMMLGRSLLDYLKSLSNVDYVEFVKPKPKTYKFLPAETLTDEEILRIEKSKQSGVASLDDLKKFLRQ